MPNESVKARLKFLATSAYFYASIDPATSAHLRQELNHFALDGDIDLKEAGTNRACKACGSIFILGRTLRTTIIGAQRLKNFRSKLTRNNIRKQMLLQCLVCRRSIKVPLNSLIKPCIRHQKRSQSQGASTSKHSISTSVVQNITRPNRQSRSLENLSSKKRAKARKISGLRAALDRSKVARSEPKEPQMDLMDFMKLS